MSKGNVTAEEKARSGASAAADGAAGALAVTDDRTGKEYEFPITDGSVRAMDFRQVKTDPADFGLLSYDPAFLNGQPSAVAR